jgi:hypothetical protein
LGIVSFLFPYVWDILLPASIPAGQESFYLALHRLWIPLSGTLLLVATAVLMFSGFLIVWHERAYVDPGRRAVLGLAFLAFALSIGAAVLQIVVSLALAFVYASNLRGALVVADVGLAVGLGLTLYWLLLGVGVRQARLAGIVAVVTGFVSSLLAPLWRATNIAGLGIIGVSAGLVSLTLWLALFLLGYEELRLRSGSPPTGLPA